MSQTPEEIGQLIRNLRKERKMTQLELSIKLGIDKSTFAAYERGRNNFTVATLKKIAEAMGATFKVELFFEKE
ncbi:helix-turn-helix domain-containing protein [Larkinella terrae]|uniref:Helix-turn-helix domain-containing protein n=1 Tax=Larkinella terrae TaxID=2025311 RepID=A0A7K0EDB4_9BACT|nr:helix-turn-helix transcriptional regulator [Larkinella terrae]MRS59864.1 helix-turn-helix domain-containing protein [Larkinella terrae]